MKAINLLLLTISGSYVASISAVQHGGAPLWVDHVTSSRRVSVWTNKAQLEDEKMNPSLSPKDTHPWALQTRWDLSQNVEGQPKDTLFVLIEMGSTPFCGTDSCSETIVLFGLNTANENGDTRLHSYKVKSMPKLVKALHANATDTSPLIHFNEMEADNVTLLYKFYPGNSSFYGVGGGGEPDGSRIEVRELIGNNLVAPLEVFYDPQGNPMTEYVTPLLYHHHDAVDVTTATSNSGSEWDAATFTSSVDSPKPPVFPPQVAPVMPTMFTAHVRGFEGNITEHGVWHYDWPRARLRNDYVIKDGKDTYNTTQLWLASEQKFYFFQGSECSYITMDVGMLRPDPFEHAMKTDPYNATSNPGGGRYTGREMMDNRWADHFQYGLGDQQFNIWHDIETNLPLYDYGPGGDGIAGNHWLSWTIGKVPEAQFDLDTSQCKKTLTAPSKPRFPRWIAMP